MRRVKAACVRKCRHTRSSAVMEFLLTVGVERAGATRIPQPVRDTPKTNLPIGFGTDQVIVVDHPPLVTFSEQYGHRNELFLTTESSFGLSHLMFDHALFFRPAEALDLSDLGGYRQSWQLRLRSIWQGFSAVP